MRTAYLPKRVFQSPLILYTNFKSGGRINLIRLNKPYANGDSYAIYGTAEGSSSRMFKTWEHAKNIFNIMVDNAEKYSPITSKGHTGNPEKLYA